MRRTIVIVLAKYIICEMVACAFFCLISDFIYVVCMQFINKRSINAAKSMHYLFLPLNILRYLVVLSVQSYKMPFSSHSTSKRYLSRCSFSLRLVCVSVCVSLCPYLVSSTFTFSSCGETYIFRFAVLSERSEKKTHETNQQIKNKCSMRESQNLGPHKILHLAWNSIAWYWKSTESRWCVQRHSMILALCW